MYTVVEIGTSGIYTISPDSASGTLSDFLNTNFTAIAAFLGDGPYVPYSGATGEVNLNGQQLAGVGTFSSDARNISSDGSGNLTVAQLITDGLNTGGFNHWQMGWSGTYVFFQGYDYTGGGLGYLQFDIDGNPVSINTNSGQPVNIGGTLAVIGSTSLDNGSITTDGSGNITLNTLNAGGGNLTSDSSGNLTASNMITYALLANGSLTLPGIPHHAGVLTTGGGGVLNQVYLNTSIGSLSVVLT